MAQQRRPNMAVSLVMFIGGTILILYVLYSNGLNSGMSVQEVWNGLSRGLRTLALVGFITSAYGLGAVISNLTRKRT